jgi:hypothetical protein
MQLQVSSRVGPPFGIGMGGSHFKTQVGILWIDDGRLTVCGDCEGGSPPNHDAGHARGISQLVVTSESSNFPRLGLWSLGLGDRRTFFDLVEADVAGSADLLVGLVLGDPEFFDHRQRRELLVLLCLVLCDLCFYLRPDDSRFTAS